MKKYDDEFLNGVIQSNLINIISKGWIRHESDFDNSRISTLEVLSFMRDILRGYDDIHDAIHIIEASFNSMNGHTHDTFKAFLTERKKMETTEIISAFPGTGKTYYYNNHKDISLDSDSSDFSWVIEDGVKVRNPEFPKNYIEHIKQNMGKYQYIFVSSHKDVRDMLKHHGIEFTLVYPSIDRKDEFIQRYIDRGSPDAFVKLISSNWEAWITECVNETRCVRKQLTHGSISDYIVADSQ